MESWRKLYSGDTAPSQEQVDAYIDSLLWQKLNNHLQHAYAAKPKMEYSCCSMQQGWNIKYRKGGKSLCTLYPMSGYFIALIVIGCKEMPEAELLIPLCSEYVQSVFTGTQALQGQKWLMIDVKNESSAEDVLRLIDLRARTKK